jgi:hypothetical protein
LPRFFGFQETIIMVEDLEIDVGTESESDRLDRWRQEFHDDYEQDRIDRDEAIADNIFANATDANKAAQWNSQAYEQRKEALRPILIWNRIPTYIQHVANAGRQNKPQIKVSAGDGGTDETAQMYEARIRQILYECDGDIARDTARDQQVTSGRGFIRVTTEYIPGTKEQRACVDRIENQFSVVYGPARKYDRSDADRCWVITQITKAEHRRLYGPESLLNRTDFAPIGDFGNDWVGIGPKSDLVQIAERFEKVYGEEDKETGERQFIVMRYVFNGAEILDREKARTDDIGIVPQWGRECVVDEVQRHISLINPAKDPQRLVNLYVSNIAENIAMQPKTRYKAAIGQIPSHMEDFWSGNKPMGIAYYKRFDDQGRDLGIPETETHEPPIQALSEGLQQAIEGIKSAMGIYDASMGQRSNETSGIAINRRKVEGEVTNFHFPDNEARTWNRIGRILIKMIDALDQDKKSVPVRYENGKTEMVPLGTPITTKTGKQVIHKLDAQAYLIHVEQGPSYANAVEQKQEAEQGILQAAPELMLTGVGVNWIRNSGRPGADEDADALEAYINMKTPGLIPQPDAPPMSPEVSAKIQQLTADNAKAHAFAQSLHEQLQTKQPEIQQKELDSQRADATKRYTVDEQEKTKRTIALASLNADQATAKLEQELNIVHQKLDRTHELMMKLVDQQHQKQQAEAAAQNAQAAQVSDQSHAAAMQAAEPEPASE